MVVDSREALVAHLLGELGPEEDEALRERLAADPELRESLKQLKAAQALAALPLKPPPELTWDEPPRRRRGHEAWYGPAVLAAALLLLSLVALPGLRLPEGQLRVVAQAHEAFPPSHHDFIPAEDPQALAVAFEARGLAPTMAMVGDMRPLGLELEGGHLSGDGTVVVYVDGSGRRFECHMLPDGPTGTPDHVLSRPGAPDLEVYPLGADTAVVWREHGMICVLVSASHEAVVALAKAKVWGEVG